MNGKFLLALTGIATAGTLASIATPASAAIFAMGSNLSLSGDYRAPGLAEGETGSRFSGPLLFGPEAADSSAFAEVGEYAFTSIGGASNTGDFAGYNVPNPLPSTPFYTALIQSFGPSDPLPVTPFLNLPGTGGGDAPASPAATFNLLSFIVTDVDASSFEAKGDGFFLSEGDTTPGTFQFTGQGLNLPANDFSGSYSATLTATPETVTVPEPTSTLGLLVFGALGGGSWLKKRKQKVAA